MNANGSWHSQPDCVQRPAVRSGSSAHTSARRTRIGTSTLMQGAVARRAPPCRAAKIQSQPRTALLKEVLKAALWVLFEQSRQCSLPYLLLTLRGLPPGWQVALAPAKFARLWMLLNHV